MKTHRRGGIHNVRVNWENVSMEASNSRCCPACSRRDTGLVDPQCPICDGKGVLMLGRPALARFAPEVVADAVELSLESAARDVLAQTVDNRVQRQALQRRMNALRGAGVLGKEPAPTSGAPRPRGFGDRNRQAVKLAGSVAGPRYQPGDRAVLDAPPLEWGPFDRPMERGGIPGFSKAGFICSLSRVSDPYDPLGTDTRRLAEARRKTRAEAEQLELAVVEWQKVRA